MFPRAPPEDGRIDREAYSVGDAILETDKLYFTVTMFPVREESQDQSKCRCLRIGIAVGQRYIWDVFEDGIGYAVERHYCLG